MNEEQKKRLTEFIGECWHDMKEEILECRNCGKSKIEIFMEPYKVSLNRTFLTPNDQQACMEALVRGGLWKEFYYYYWKRVKRWRALWTSRLFESRHSSLRRVRENWWKARQKP